MSERYTEDQAIAAVTRLTRPVLARFIEAKIVVPVQSGEGLYFRRIDLVRMELLCELRDQFEMDEEALGIVISLIDQLHDLRGELHCLMRALEAEPDEVRQRIGEALRQGR